MQVSKERLEFAMLKSGYNFKQLAEASGVSRTTLSYINNGKSCRADVISRISKALRCEPTELIERG